MAKPYIFQDNLTIITSTYQSEAAALGLVVEELQY